MFQDARALGWPRAGEHIWQGAWEGQASPGRWGELSFEEGRCPPDGAGRTKGQRDVRMGNSQGRTETDQGSIVSSREGAKEFRENQQDDCYFLFGKILF